MKKTKLHKVLAIVLTMLIVFAMPTVAASANDVPEPTGVELTGTEPTGVELTDTEPTEAELTDIEPTEAEPTDTEITDVELTDIEITDVELTDTETTEAEPTDTIEPEVDDAPEISVFNGTMVLAKADTKEYELTFYVIDSESHTPLAGVTYELWAIDGKKEKLDTKTSGSDGEVTFKNVEKGNYEATMTAVPSGYYLLSYPLAVSDIDFDNDWLYRAVLLYSIPSDDTKYNLNYTVHETDFMGKKLSGVTIELWEINSASFEKIGSVIDTKTTNSNGEVTFKSLKKGNYGLFVTAVPEGYILPPSYWINGIVMSDQFNNYYTEDGVHTVSSGGFIKPTLPEDTGYNLSVEIFEDNSYTKKVPGVTVELWKSDKDTGTDLLIGTQTTNSDGDITFENVLKGNYVVHIVGVPEGYDSPTYVMQLGEENFDNYYLQNEVPTIGISLPLSFDDDFSSSSSSGTTAQGSNPTGSTGSGSGSTGGSNSNFPQTGDNSNMLGYAFVSMFSLVALAVIAVKRKRINDR